MGENATVKNGKVTGCGNGVSIAGDGGHVIPKLISHSNDDSGFKVNEGSNGNHFEKNTSNNNGSDGFNIESSENTFEKNLSSSNDNEGFDVDKDSDNNSFSRNVSSGNGEAGFEVGRGSILNEFIKNLAADNGWTGDRGHGFYIKGSYSRFHQNTATGNAHDGFSIETYRDVLLTGNELLKNRAEDNGEYGIHINDSATYHTFTQNEAFGNGILDLADDNVNCDNNEWLKNEFVTSSQNCIE